MPATATVEGQIVKFGRRGQSDLSLNEEQALVVKARNGSPASIELLVRRSDTTRIAALTQPDPPQAPDEWPRIQARQRSDCSMRWSQDVS
jgi:hypothetical protein